MSQWEQSAERLAKRFGRDVKLSTAPRIRELDGRDVATGFELVGAYAEGATSVVLRNGSDTKMTGALPAGCSLTVNGQALRIAQEVPISGATIAATLESGLSAAGADGDAVTVGRVEFEQRARLIMRWRGSAPFRGVSSEVMERTQFVVVWPTGANMPEPGKGWRCDAGDPYVGLVLQAARRPGAWVLPCGAG